MEPVMTSELELVERAREGDRKALEALVSRYERRLYRFGLKMCGNRDDAADVLQDTLVAAMKELPRFRGEAAVTTWLYAIARSYCRKHRSHQSRPGGLEDNSASEEAGRKAADEGARPDEQVAGRQLRVAIDEALAKLPPAYREVVVLRDVEGLTAPEAAKVLGLHVNALKTRLHRGRALLKRSLADQVGMPEPSRKPRCASVQKQLWSALQGDISAGLCRTVEAHVDTCEECGTACDAVKLLANACRAGPPPALPPELRAELRKAVAEAVADGA